jgi:hypothetical protein
MASKKTDSPPAGDGAEGAKAEQVRSRPSKRPAPMRRQTIEVQLAWLELDPPVAGSKKEPILREEKIVWRKRATPGEETPNTAPAPNGANGAARARPVIIRKALPREEEPAADAPRAAQSSGRRSKRPPAHPIAREEAAETTPPPRRHSKPPRR